MIGLTIALVVVALATIYFYVKHLYSYWQQCGIPYLKPSFPFGNFGKVFMKKWPLCVQVNELYRSTSEPFVGTFMLQSPFLLVRDPELIRNILIADFQHFSDRDYYMNEKDDPLSASMGAFRGQHWQDMRAKLTPAFTSHKMKQIFSTSRKCGNQLQKHLSNMIKTNETVEMWEVSSCYALNIIASTVFGIDVDCLANRNHPFQETSERMFEINLKNGLRFVGWFFHPKFLKWSKLRIVDREVEQFFFDLVTQTLEAREQEHIVRNDLFQSLIELRNNITKTPTNADEWKAAIEKCEQKSLSVEELAAETFGFFIACVKGTALGSSYCLYEIAKHPDIQQKINEEIEHVMAQHNSQLSYESINELKYLDCCMDETFRKYQLFDLARLCVKDYNIPGTNVTIEKGTSIIIPSFALHNDEKFYPDPHKFDPTRFSIENKAGKNIVDMPYLPFGDGPRNCIGQKLGKMLAKIGIYSILQQYHVELDDRHIGKKMKFALNMHPIGGIHLKLKAK